MKRLLVLLLLLAFVPRPAAALSTDELLALVAMPLAVAAVSELTDVPSSDLVDLVTLMNGADVRPTQFVQVIRYVPVALVVENDQPDFVEFVRTQTVQGVRSDALVTVIEQRLNTFDVETNFATEPVAFVDQNFIPTIVQRRVEEVHAKRHPHGGPPGQLKKQLGLQTGAEVVHGRRQRERARVIVTEPARVPQRVVVVDDGRGRGPDRVKVKGPEKSGHGHGKGGGEKGHGKKGKGR